MIPCYWENTPSGCLNPHCVFQHTKPCPMLKSAVERVQEIKEVDNEGGCVETSQPYHCTVDLINTRVLLVAKLISLSNSYCLDPEEVGSVLVILQEPLK